MKILFITTYYPPDTAMAARRPYEFTKYMADNGNDVTVIRSGLINRLVDASYDPNPHVRVISYLGDNSPANLAERGELPSAGSLSAKSRIAFLPYSLQKRASKVYHWLLRPYSFYQERKKWRYHFERQKAAIDKLRDERFDIVFSTFGDFENMFAGKYAAEVFGCKWIMDFRDLVAQRISQPWWEYLYKKRVQRSISKKADICTAVSNGVSRQISNNAITIYNGFDRESTEKKECFSEDKGLFRICYTGSIYGRRGEAFCELLKALCLLKEHGRIDINKTEIMYAGANGHELQQVLRQYGLETVLNDCGYVGKKEAAHIQCNSDLFVVLSWNTNAEQGIMTGKFYDGIKARKPILSIIVGNKANSELNELNQKYNYGYCYEKVRAKEQFSGLCSFIENGYQEKIKTGSWKWASLDSLYSDFCYDKLGNQLYNLCKDLVKERINDQ